MEEPVKNDDRELARLVRDAGVQCMLDAYEDAGIRGLCGEGRFEVAVDALRQMDLDAVLRGVRFDEKPR